MAHTYTIAMEALINEIGIAVYRKDYWEGGDDREGRKFPPIKNSPVPFIPCQYHRIDERLRLPSGNFPGGNLYPDKSWEGARVTGSGQRRRTEYFGGFNVLKDNKGRCLIPDTPNNRLRLTKMANGTKQVLETELFTDERGTTRSRRVMRTVSAPPTYTMIQGEAASANMDAIIKTAVANALREAAESAALPAPVDVTPKPQRLKAAPGVVDERAPAPVPAPAVVAPDPIVVAPEAVEPETAIDEWPEENEQPDAPAAGGDGDVPPPAKPSPALTPAPRTVRGAKAPPPPEA